MSEIVDLNFCNTCEYRGKRIDGYYCAMSGADYLLKGMVDRNVLTFEDGEVPRISSAAEVGVGMGAELMLEAAQCIKQVQSGGEPLPPQ